MAHASSPDKQAEAASTTPHHVLQLSGLLGSGKYSDLTLTCGTRSWKVHKSVLCLQSDFFAKACDGSFKEAQTNTIDLSEDNEYTIAALLHFMYHGKFDAANILPPTEYEAGGAILLHVRVVGLAQKYFIEALQKYSGESAVKLMRKCNGTSSIFSEAVYSIYTTTEDAGFGTTLRQSAVEVAMDRALTLFASDDNSSHNRDILFNETPGFMEDWARAMSWSKHTLSAANTNLEAVNDVLHGDNVKLNHRYKTLQNDFDQLNAAAEKVKDTSRKLKLEVRELTHYNKNLEQKMEGMVSIPDGPVASSSYTSSAPAPDCYRCPNCELLFFKNISWSYGYQHKCFDNGWCGQLKKGGVQLEWKEWQEHLVRKA